MQKVAALFVLVTLVNWVRSIPIDNGVEGEPEIECAADSITVNFNTRNDFQGHVYVKGRFSEQECRSDDGGRRVAGIKLPFTACGTKRERSLSPKGVFVTNTVVITFHPQFLTKVDRAYTVQCFYMEADKTVSQDLEVSEITTAFQTQTVPMPVCRYDILDGGPTGQPVKFATIGQQVYHKWTCETETVDIFCAVIHSCYVDDGAGNNVQLLNDQGCALDKYLLNNLEYQTDLMAGHEAHVFKYADKPALFFQCQISISIKEPGQQCPRPQCPEAGGPSGSGASGGSAPAPGGSKPPPAPGSRPPPPPGSRAPPPPASLAPKPRGSSPQPGSPPPAKLSSAAPPRGSTPLAPAPVSAGNERAAARRDFAQFPFRFRYARAVADAEAAARRRLAASLESVGTWDVAAQPITTLEIDNDQTTLPASLKRLQVEQAYARQERLRDGNYCFSPMSFGALIAVMAISVLTGMVVVLFSCFRRARKL